MRGIPKGGVSPGSSGLEAITGHEGQRDGRSRLIEFEHGPGPTGRTTHSPKRQSFQRRSEMVDRPRLDRPVASLGEYSEESLDRGRRSLPSDQEEVEQGYRRGATCVLFEVERF